MDWELTIAAHWPHDRLALGIETMKSNEEYPYNTIRLYLLVLTVDFNFVKEE